MRGVGDLLGQHVRRVGDDDAALGRRLDVDRVVADAEIGDDLELRQALDQRAGRPAWRPAAMPRTRAGERRR